MGADEVQLVFLGRLDVGILMEKEFLELDG
jgi:hypothetical protein